MAEIIPAILERDFNEIKNKLAGIRGRAKIVQLDICDGAFVSSKTWPFVSGGIEDDDFDKIMKEEEGLPYWEDLDFELDMMTLDAVENFDIYMKLGPKRIIFHLSAQDNKKEFKNFLEALDPYFRDNTQIGLAVNPNADLNEVVSFSGVVDFFQCMGIDHVGAQGEEFDEKVIENIKFLKEKLPGVIIAVDGGVNFDNAEDILDAGADRLVIGSAIWKSGNPIHALEDFKDLV